jgi:uncharacterized OB-fold protein
MSGVGMNDRGLMPIPRPSIETQIFWDAVQERRLIMPKCLKCGTYRFPPSVACHVCESDEMAWVDVSGRGKVFSFVVYRRAYRSALKDKVPYVLAVIELEEGPRIPSNVVGLPVEDVECEMPVSVVYEEVRDGFLIPKFTRRS